MPMNIQSASIVIPTHNKCVNKCPFCVSRTHCNLYQNDISHTPEFERFKKSDIKVISFNEHSIEFLDYVKRLQFTRNNGCNVAILTGTGEPPQNIPFIEFFMKINDSLRIPFENIEMQTTGVMLNEEIIQHLRKIGLTTMAFSISNIFNNDRNLELIDCNEKLRFDLEKQIELVKKYKFNLRLSLNLVNDYDQYSVPDVLKRCKELGADQVTFRKLYKSDTNTEIDQWIEDNASKDFYPKLESIVKSNGALLGILPFGAKIYDIDDICIAIDDDCMAQKIKDTYKFLILRENCRLYSSWYQKSSLIF